MSIPFIISIAIHIIGAALLVGGVFFFRVILLKYAQRHGGLDDALKATLSKRWIHLTWNLLLVMLITGGYQVMSLLDDWKSSESRLPHKILGAKLLVFVAIVLVSALATAAKGEKATKRAGYMAINVVLGIVILFLSAWLARSY